MILYRNTFGDEEYNFSSIISLGAGFEFHALLIAKAAPIEVACAMEAA